MHVADSDVAIWLPDFGLSLSLHLTRMKGVNKNIGM